jgi:hypothetical protein
LRTRTRWKFGIHLEYGNSTIEYVTNRKSSLFDLYVLDPLADL